MKNNVKQKYDNLVVSLILINSSDVSSAEASLHKFLERKEEYYDSLCDQIDLLLEKSAYNNERIVLDFSGQARTKISDNSTDKNCLEVLRCTELSPISDDIVDYLNIVLSRLEHFVEIKRSLSLKEYSVI